VDQFREAHGQLSYSLRMEWGPTGADAVRNRQAAATWLLHRREADPAIRVAIIAAGERWRDGSLRPGYPEDVDTAAQLDRSHAVPVLEGEAFAPR
jgi:hypothetical protein